MRDRLEYLRSRVSLLGLAGQFTDLSHYTRGEWAGLCPLHPESHPSFFMNGETGQFYCHGCGAGGDLFRFVELLCACDFRDAVRQVARLAKGKALSLPVVDVSAYRCQGVWGAGSPPERAERMRAERDVHRRKVAFGAMRSALAREADLPPCMRADIYTPPNNSPNE